mmetsp:Transcript_39734/g.80059  ORF Transcript_39734/g.80059 Transcript_39734/m.80059 type:complete len:85 (-) Transcript_39734:77-331(-)
MENKLEEAEALIAAGANLESLNRWQDTPLILACVNWNGDLAKMLIAKSANINAKNDRNETPLKMARTRQLTEVVEILEEKGAQE